jgi:hypothetical protein
MSNEGCRIRVGPRRVRVNVACPHATTAGFGMYYSDYPSARAEPIAERPIWREGNPERDTGGSAVLLGGGPDSTFVTGLKPYCGRNDYGEPWPHSHTRHGCQALPQSGLIIANRRSAPISPRCFRTLVHLLPRTYKKLDQGDRKDPERA